MVLRNILLVLALLLVMGPGTYAAEPTITHRLLFFEYGKGPNRMLELDRDGKQVSEHNQSLTTVRALGD